MKNKIIQIIKEQINLDLGLHKSAWKYPHVKGEDIYNDLINFMNKNYQKIFNLMFDEGKYIRIGFNKKTYDIEMIFSKQNRDDETFLSILNVGDWDSFDYMINEGLHKKFFNSNEQYHQMYYNEEINNVSHYLLVKYPAT